MKIIFLDIDGVICTKFNKRDEFGHLFNPECVFNLKNILLQTNAKIVISSTWRYAGIETLRTMWEMRGLPGEIIDITPIKNTITTRRGQEIEEWLSLNEVDNYVIIDDNNDMLADQQDRFVLITEGLNKEAAEKIINLLNN